MLGGDLGALVLDGRRLARTLEEELAPRVQAYAQRAGGAAPSLAIILVGADAAALRYARLKTNACRRVGMESRQIACLPGATTAEVLAEIDRLAADPRVSGIFLQTPLPGQVDERRCFDRIAIAKDVGGDSSASFGRLALGEGTFGPATPAGVMRLLSGYGVALEGKQAVVVGRGAMLAKPMALMLLGANATVTICHAQTPRLRQVVERAEVVVAAVGRPGFIPGKWLRDGAVVVDTGYHPGAIDAVGAIGDVDLSTAAARCSAYTPVPGGVGPMTVAVLLERTLAAAERAS
jgi:methylenetetrahydrofolate dehydrogenase (NADP+)/methenyltetrahydrofolate cyclohydrolase